MALIDLDHDPGSVLADRHPTVTYPHGGNPILRWDGRRPHPNIRLHLVHGPGHAAAFALHGHPVPAVSVGFTYADIAAPRYPDRVRRVLFAPSHPDAFGIIDSRLRHANADALGILADSGLDVTIREGGGLATADIDAADLVVGDGTVAALALARGVPTLFVGSDVDQAVDDNGRMPSRYDAYARFIRYPYDVADGPLDWLIDTVCRPNDAVDRWRSDFVGDQFNPQLAVALIEAAAAGA